MGKNVQSNSPLRKIDARRKTAISNLKNRLKLDNKQLMDLPRGKRFKDDEVSKYREFLKVELENIEKKVIL